MLNGDNGRYGKLFTHPFAWAPFVLIGDGWHKADGAVAQANGGQPAAR
jgi:hypothetical protein